MDSPRNFGALGAGLRARLDAAARGNKAADAVFSGFVLTFSLLMVIPLVAILGFILVKGASFIVPGIFLADESGQGILHAIVGSFVIVGIAAAIAIPVAILVGMYLSEAKKGWFPSFARISVDVLQGVPSIVVGILAYIVMVVPAGHNSAISGSVALAIIMLPTVIKSTEESLKLVPQSLKEAAYGLGAPKYLVMLRIVLPAGKKGVVTGILVGLARILGETAPLIYTAAGNSFLSADPGNLMETMPHLINNYYVSSLDWQVNNAWAAAFVLTVLVLALNLITKLVINRKKGGR